jgi:hypothetical protein
MRGGLVDDADQCAKLLGAGGYSRVVQRICHLGFSFGWDFMGETIGEARSSCQQAYPYRILPSRHLPAASRSAVHLELPVARGGLPRGDRGVRAVRARRQMLRQFSASKPVLH